MSIIEDVIAIGLVIVLLIYRERSVQHIVRFQGRYFQRTLEVAEVRSFLIWFAIVALLVSLGHAWTALSMGVQP